MFVSTFLEAFASAEFGSGSCLLCASPEKLWAHGPKKHQDAYPETATAYFEARPWSVAWRATQLMSTTLGEFASAEFGPCSCVWMPFGQFEQYNSTNSRSLTTIVGIHGRKKTALEMSKKEGS
eukprot:s2981_g1.t1